MSAPNYFEKCEGVHAPTMAFALHKPTSKLIDVRSRLSRMSWGRMIRWRKLIMSDRYGDVPRYQCPICNTALYLLSTKKHKLFFQHMPTESVCALKEKGNNSREAIREFIYGARKESQKHRDLISAIANSLKHDDSFNGIEIEPTVSDSQNSKLRRYPDVLSELGGRPIVFEAQVSSTFLDVIDARRNFYARNNMELVWIFPSFDENDRRIAEDDIIAQNNGIAIVVNEETLAESQLAKAFMVRIHTYTASSQDWYSEIKPFSVVLANIRGERSGDFETEIDKQRDNLKALCSELAGLFPIDDKVRLASLSAYLKSQNVKFPTNRFLEHEWFPTFEDFGIERHLLRMVQVIETAHSGDQFGYGFQQKPFLQIANSLLESDPFALTVYGPILRRRGHQHALNELKNSPRWQSKVNYIRENWKMYKSQSQLSNFERDVLRLFYPEYVDLHSVNGVPF